MSQPTDPTWKVHSLVKQCFFFSWHYRGRTRQILESFRAPQANARPLALWDPFIKWTLCWLSISHIMHFYNCWKQILVEFPFILEPIGYICCDQRMVPKFHIIPYLPLGAIFSGEVRWYKIKCLMFMDTTCWNNWNWKNYKLFRLLE